MRILSWEAFVRRQESNPVAVSVGVFDGVHRGHRLLFRLVAGKKPEMESAVITFMENPKKLLRPGTFKCSIFSLERKLEAFDAEGLDTCVLIDFSTDFGTLSGADFLGLLAKANVRFLTVGPNFKCGHKMDTNSAALVEICGRLGIEALVADPVVYAGHPISSTRIRNAILEGRLSEAADMLGRSCELEVEVPSAAGPALGSPKDRSQGGCILLPRPGVLLPPDGSYRIGLNPGQTEECDALLEGGFIRLNQPSSCVSGRVTIMNSVSQECKEK